MMDPVRALDNIYKIVSAFYDAGFLYSAHEKERVSANEKFEELARQGCERIKEKEIASNVVKLNPGNGAREALIKFMGGKEVDLLLANLWMEGFKVVPLDAKDMEQ